MGILKATTEVAQARGRQDGGSSDSVANSKDGVVRLGPSGVSLRFLAYLLPLSGVAAVCLAGGFGVGSALRPVEISVEGLTWATMLPSRVSWETTKPLANHSVQVTTVRPVQTKWKRMARLRIPVWQQEALASAAAARKTAPGPIEDALVTSQAMPSIVQRDDRAALLEVRRALLRSALENDFADISSEGDASLLSAAATRVCRDSCKVAGEGLLFATDGVVRVPENQPVHERLAPAPGAFLAASDETAKPITLKRGSPVAHGDPLEPLFQVSDHLKTKQRSQAPSKIARAPRNPNPRLQASQATHQPIIVAQNLALTPGPSVADYPTAPDYSVIQALSSQMTDGGPKPVVSPTQPEPTTPEEPIRHSMAAVTTHDYSPGTVLGSQQKPMSSAVLGATGVSQAVAPQEGTASAPTFQEGLSGGAPLDVSWDMKVFGVDGDVARKPSAWFVASADHHLSTLVYGPMADDRLLASGRVELLAWNTVLSMAKDQGIDLKDGLGLLFGRLAPGYRAEVMGRAERAIYFNTAEGNRYFIFLNVAEGAHVVRVSPLRGSGTSIASSVPIQASTATQIDLLPATGTVTLTGSVAWDGDGGPIAGATIQLPGRPEAGALTDAEGRFTLSGVSVAQGSSLPIDLEMIPSSGFPHRYRVMVGPGEKLRLLKLKALTEDRLATMIGQLEGGLGPESGMLWVEGRKWVAKHQKEKYLRPDFMPVTGDQVSVPELYTVSPEGHLIEQRPLSKEESSFTVVQFSTGSAFAKILDAKGEALWSRWLTVSPGKVSWISVE